MISYDYMQQGPYKNMYVWPGLQKEFKGAHKIWLYFSTLVHHNIHTIKLKLLPYNV